MDSGGNGGWQPIETAPKDGTRINLSDGAGHVGTGHWGMVREDEGGEWIGFASPNHLPPSFWMAILKPPKVLSVCGSCYGDGAQVTCITCDGKGWVRTDVALAEVQGVLERRTRIGSYRITRIGGNRIGSCRRFSSETFRALEEPACDGKRTDQADGGLGNQSTAPAIPPGWYPISTAPKDGTVVLATDRRDFSLAKWISDERYSGGGFWLSAGLYRELGDDCLWHPISKLPFEVGIFSDDYERLLAAISDPFANCQPRHNDPRPLMNRLASHGLGGRAIKIPAFNNINLMLTEEDEE